MLELVFEPSQLLYNPLPFILLFELVALGYGPVQVVNSLGLDAGKSADARARWIGRGYRELTMMIGHRSRADTYAKDDLSLVK